MRDLLRKVFSRRWIGWPRPQEGRDAEPVVGLSNWMRFSLAPDYIVGGDYLHRWWVLPRNPLFNIYLHRIGRSDDDRALHDHPWVNCSLVLRGAYDEVCLTPAAMWWWREYLQEHSLTEADPDYSIGFGRHLETHRVRTSELFLVARRARTPHRLEVVEGPVWTLFLTGPVIRDWGFHCPKGWVHYKVFTDPMDKGAIGRGCD
jgi:hypothetical protein